MRTRGFSGLGRIAAVVAAATLATAAVPSRAETVALLPSARTLPIGYGDSEPTSAWKDFCRRLPDECAVDLSEPATTTLTPEAWELVRSVNVHVNRTIIPITDRAHWGVDDRWDYPDDGKGDCEDIQLLKRKLLAAAGLPRRAMRMTVVIDKEGDGHAVLMVRTDRGDFILDNKTNAVLSWDETGYEFIKREGADGLAWAALGRDERTVVASRSVRPPAKRPAARKPW